MLEMKFIKNDCLGCWFQKIIFQEMKFEGDSAGPTIILKAGGVPSSRLPSCITKMRPPILGVGFGPLNFAKTVRKVHQLTRTDLLSEHCSGPSTSENGKIWQKSGFSPFWLHWLLCGWACRGCVHNCCRACMCAVLS